MTDVVYKYAASIPVSVELIEDANVVRAALDETFRRWTHPWEFPDLNPMPAFVPFPRLARLNAWRLSVADRWRDIRYVARYGIPSCEED